MYPASYKSQRVAVWILLSLGALVMAVTPPAPGSAQSTSAAKIEQNQIRYVSPASGKQMYAAYCAACHGVDGKGNAKAAAALAHRPSDLTLLSSGNGGKFPSYRVRDLLLDEDYYHDRAADKMPVWAPAFKSLQKHHPDLVRLRVSNLVAYLEKMQAPSASAGTDRGRSDNPR